MLQKSTKLARIQKVVQDIKEEPLYNVPKKTTSNRPSRLRHVVTESTPLITGVMPLQEDPKLDAMMDNIKRILDKRKRQPQAEQLKSMLTTNQVKQIYGSRRHMIEVRFKEFYNSRIISPHISQEAVVEVINTPEESKSSRLFQYQKRIGLVKKRDPLELKIQEISQRHRTKL